MELIPQLRQPWKSVTMDFIIKLLKSKDSITDQEYNSILMITNWFTKESKFIPINKVTDAPGTVYLVM
jgi:hypothetical protein